MPPQVIIGIVVFISLLIILSIYYVKKSITCNDTNTCSNLVNLGEWRLNSETANDANLVRECTKNGFIDGCKQLSKEATNATVQWTDTSCNKFCGTEGVGNKSVIYSNKTFTSANTYPCNRVDCSNLVTFGNWTLTAQDISFATLTRTCTNKNEKKDACSLLSETFTKKIIPWSTNISCTKPCNTGIVTKTVRLDDVDYRSDPSTNPMGTCNTEPCDSLVTLGNWTFVNRVSPNSNTANVTRTCTNINSNRNACSLIPDSEINKQVILGLPGGCNQSCGSGVSIVGFTLNGQNINVNEPCNTQPCTLTVNLTNFGNVDISTSTIPQYGSLANLFLSGIYRSEVMYYNTTDGTYTNKNNITTTDNEGTVHRGIWVQIKFSSSTIIKRYSFNRGGLDYPIDWILLASNDGNNWTLLDTRPNIDNNTVREFTISNTVGYLFYRLVIKKVKGSFIPTQFSDSTLNLNSLNFFTT